VSRIERDEFHIIGNCISDALGIERNASRGPCVFDLNRIQDTGSDGRVVLGHFEIQVCAVVEIEPCGGTCRNLIGITSERIDRLALGFASRRAIKKWARAKKARRIGNVVSHFLPRGLTTFRSDLCTGNARGMEDRAPSDWICNSHAEELAAVCGAWGRGIRWVLSAGRVGSDEEPSRPASIRPMRIAYDRSHWSPPARH
jgi:hypothetical protein